MPLTTGARLGPYEILSALGAGGMSACGHAEREAPMPSASISEGSRRGWGPGASAKKLTPSPCRLATGARLGPYEILSALGAGGMGEVYKARDTRLDRLVAVKVLPETLAADPQFRARFELEARAISQLAHPQHLHAARRRRGPRHRRSSSWSTSRARRWPIGIARGALPLAEALPIAMQIAGALDRGAPRRHRPSRSEARQRLPHEVGAKLLDFGLAKSSPASSPARCRCCRRRRPRPITAQGAILGTFQYMAPEQIEGQDADARTDIFAFGAVLYEMLAGKRAFEGKSQATLIGSIMAASRRRFRPWRPRRRRSSIDWCAPASQRIRTIAISRRTNRLLLQSVSDVGAAPSPPAVGHAFTRVAGRRPAWSLERPRLRSPRS